MLIVQVAHELGHAVLHTKIAMMHGFQEMEVFDDRSIEENEANFFAAELLLEDREVLECLSEHTFFETAKMLYVPAALLDYKFSLLHEKGELVNSMYIRKADFLKGDLHAYDNDIDYGDIWISVFYFLTEKVHQYDAQRIMTGGLFSCHQKVKQAHRPEGQNQHPYIFW